VIHVDPCCISRHTYVLHVLFVEQNNMEVIKNVKLELQADMDQPRGLIFSSKGRYKLSDGYSVKYCEKLPDTESMEFKQGDKFCAVCK
jgi:hypothetical protein